MVVEMDGLDLNDDEVTFPGTILYSGLNIRVSYWLKVCKKLLLLCRGKASLALLASVG